MNKTLSKYFLKSLLCIACAPAHAALERIGDFALLDDSGEFHQVSRYQHKKAVVIMSYVKSCANMEEMLQRYADLRDGFPSGEIEFLLLDPQGMTRNELAALDVEFPVLQDEGQLIAEKLQIQHAGAVRVLNPGRLSLYYRGNSMDAGLQTTLASLLSQPITDTVVNSDTLSGAECGVSFPAKEKHTATIPDYASDIAPIVIENCFECHRIGGVGPFALDKYISLLGWSPMIREVLLNKRMPPAQVDPDLVKSRNARYMPVDQLQTLVHWIDAGAPRGLAEDDPLETATEELGTTNDTNWLLGVPDFIVSVPAIQVPATGILDYVYVDIDLPFEEDKWVRAVQYQAGAPAVLHHLMTFVTAPEEDFWGTERDSANEARRFVEGYAPGEAQATEYPEGTAVLIPKGHKLSMQFHYVSNGQATIDETQLALYFAEPQQSSGNTPLQERLTQPVAAQFVVPANDPEFPMLAEHTFNEDVVITGVRARMNYRGKKMKFSVEQQDGSMRDIFSVPAYNYGWQPHYILAEPVVVPAGLRVQVSGSFDNSVSNPANPDPGREMRSGVESDQEMFTGYFTYHRLVK